MRTLPIWLLALCLIGPGVPVASGQDQPAPPPAAPATPDVPTIKGLEDKIAALGPGEAAAAELYQQAIDRLKRANAAAERTASFQQEITSAPARVEAINEELARSVTDPKPVVPPDATLAQLEQGEAQAIAELNAARSLSAELQSEASRRQDRRAQIPETIARLRLRLSELEGLPKAPAADTAVADARYAAQVAELREVTAEIEALEAELASYDARRNLLPLRREREARRITQGEKLVEAWRELVSAKRQSEAERSAREAERLKREASRQHPALQAYAAETQRLAEQRTQAGSIPQKIAIASQQAADARAAFADLRQRYTAVQQRIAVSGLDRSTGLLLRREYDSLPNVGSLDRRVMAAQRELEDVEYTLFQRQEDRIGSADVSRVAQSLVSEIDPEQQAAALPVATELAAARRDVLAELVNDADRYQDVLIDLNLGLNRLADGTAAYESFIKERILWVRSITSDRVPLTESFSEAISWLADPATWSVAFERIRQDIIARFPTSAFSITILTLLVAAGRWSKRELSSIAELVGRYRTDSFAHTLRAIGLTLISSLPIPTLLWWLGWVLLRPVDQLGFAVGLGEGLQAASYMLLPLTFIKRMCRPGGLADAHFRWPAAPVRSARRQLRWFIPVVVPTVVLVVAFDRYGSDAANAAMGRLAFTVLMTAVAVLIGILARPSGPIVTEVLGREEGGWLDRLRFIWYPALLAIPVALALLSWVGYYYTALQFELRLEITTAVLFGLLIINGVLMRWLFLARRRVAVEDARRRREQAVSDAPTRKPGESAPTDATSQPLDEDKVNLPGLSTQTRQLFRSALWVTAAIGLYLTWADVLPALRMFDRVVVYPTPTIVEVNSTDSIELFEAPGGSEETAGSAGGAGKPAPAPSNASSQTGPASVVPGLGEAEGGSAAEAPVTITLADVGLGLVFLIATFIAFRNLPSLIEIAVLQRLPLDAGSRYALSTVLRYVIAFIGIVSALGAINIGWSNIQWLAAALTFGLAFGLQEIFANFISGLIILAERPIRIGDTVTIGSVSGTVSRIRMRATTITDWDRKELIIPNKNFITGEVINWTLSDPLLRLIIPVGVSYSADVRLTEATLLRVASEQPDIRRDPMPNVVFKNFGDSTLNFELRVFLPNIDYLVSVRHDLHMRIIEAFRKADIEIAFPQRDLHIRSVGGDLRDLIVGDTSDAAPKQVTASRSDEPARTPQTPGTQAKPS